MELRRGATAAPPVVPDAAPWIRFVVTASDRAWEAALHGCAAGYVATVRRRPPERPTNRHHRDLVAAVDALDAALSPFGSGPNRIAPWSGDILLAQLRAWAVQRIEDRSEGGRPTGIARELVADLLRLYWHGYGRRPSYKPGGPAHRFVAAFLDGVRGAEVELIDEWCPEDGEELPQRRAVACPAPDALPDLIRECRRSLTTDPPPRWWGKLGLSEPTFPD